MQSKQSTRVAIGVAIATTMSVLLLSACSQNGTPPGQSQAPASSQAASTIATTPANFTSYTGTIPQALQNNRCSLDSINGKAAASATSVATGSTLFLGGWAGDAQGRAVASSELVLKGTQQSYTVPLTTGVHRPDVAKTLNSDAMTDSGYNIAANLKGVEAGNYSLYVADPASEASDCDLHRTLTVQ